MIMPMPSLTAVPVTSMNCIEAGEGEDLQNQDYTCRKQENRNIYPGSIFFQSETMMLWKR
jgi:hypothetical protein